MKKYKLIKNFPTNDLPEGTIVTQDELGQYVSENISIFKKEDIENFSDFWEEIIEEDYAIIGFNDGFNDYYKTLEGSFTINGTRFYDEKNLLHNYEISAIKRKSDGEVFRIGDKIIWDWAHNLKKFIEIDSFVIQSNRRLYINDQYKFDTISETVTHYSDPVMVTEDGVEIFDGDPYWFIWVKCPPIGQVINKPYYVKFASLNEEDGDSWSIDAKFFSTKEKANEYIFKQSPIYTTEDGVKVFTGDTVYYVLENFIVKDYKPLKDDRNNRLHYFSSEEKADEYIFYNKPKYSLNDVLQFREIKHNYTINDIVNMLTKK